MYKAHLRFFEIFIILSAPFGLKSTVIITFFQDMLPSYNFHGGRKTNVLKNSCNEGFIHVMFKLKCMYKLKLGLLLRYLKK